MRTFVQFFFVLTIVLFSFVLFDLKHSHRHMPVGLRWPPIKQFATRFVDLLVPRTCGHRFQITRSLLIIYCFMFCFVVANARHSGAGTQEQLAYVVLFLLITNNPCLVLNCSTAETLGKGMHICTQQLIWLWQTISTWPCYYWPTPSSREPWRALGVFGRLHAPGRSILRQLGLDWWFWNKNGGEKWPLIKLWIF